MIKIFGGILIIVLIIIVVVACSTVDKSSQNLGNEEISKDEDPGKIVERPKKGPGEVVYVLPDMDNVKVAKDIIYKSEDDLELKLDVYYPLKNKVNEETSPVVLIHGKTRDKNFKDTKYLDSWGRLVAASGHQAITFNWRSNSTPEDISDLISYVKEHTSDLKIKDSKINIIAFSAGVEEGVEQALLAEDDYISRIIAYYGKMPMSILEDVNSEALPSVFIADGARDAKFPEGTNDEFIKRATEYGWKITHMVHSNGVHGFEILNDEEETYDIIKKSLELLSK